VTNIGRGPENGTTSDPPEAWPPVRRAARLVLTPVERFLSVEASSGILLLVAALLALLWANSSFGPVYEAIWHTPIGLGIGSFSFHRDLHFWINEGLMAIFFFVIGLEIRREIHAGELSDLRRAALPLVAAVGGMIFPAVIYLLLNHGGPAAAGWGVPMATDIAFAVGVLALLGKRVPPALRVLLLTLAVVDDLGAIVVIALFYSGGLKLTGLLVAAVGVGAVVLLQKLGARSPLSYVLPALIVWGGALGAGIHPTLAGVAIGLLTPVRAWYGPGGFVEQATVSLQAVRATQADPAVKSHDLLSHLTAVDIARREAISPVERLEHALHGWVAFLIMPLFAFANAGVPLGEASLEGASALAFAGVAAGLVLGKPIGIVALSWAATRLGLAALPSGVRWVEVMVVGVVAGIGFTMALFIASLAFPPGELLETAKLAILCASAVAGLGGLAVGRLVLRPLAGGDGRASAFLAPPSKN
jgi:NhaA family Na+:H+ antiporter